MDQPKVAGKVPVMVDLEAGKANAWCSCGMSANQPWCNGAHKGSVFVPHVFKAEEDKRAAMCMCKHSKNAPYCDGSHAKL